MSLLWYWSVSVCSSPLGSPLNCSRVSSEDHNLQALEKMGLVRAKHFVFHYLFIVAVRNRQSLYCFGGSAHSLWSVRFWQQSQIDHLRLGDAQHDVQFVAQQWTSYHPVKKSCLCESEMSEMEVRVCRCPMWKAHQRLFSNGTVEHLCPITFLSEIVMK